MPRECYGKLHVVVQSWQTLQGHCRNNIYYAGKASWERRKYGGESYRQLLMYKAYDLDAARRNVARQAIR